MEQRRKNTLVRKFSFSSQSDQSRFFSNMKLTSISTQREERFNLQYYLRCRWRSPWPCLPLHSLRRKRYSWSHMNFHWCIREIAIEVLTLLWEMSYRPGNTIFSDSLDVADVLTFSPEAEIIRRSAGIRSPPFTSTMSPTTRSSVRTLCFSPLRITNASCKIGNRWLFYWECCFCIHELLCKELENSIFWDCRSWC